MNAPMDPIWQEFDTRQALADALAGRVSAVLEAAVEQKGTGLLAVSGGTTPNLFFEALAARDIAWDRIIVTLVDERFVPPTSERSNERLVRERLLRNRAANARFIGLFTQSADVETAAKVAGEAISHWPTTLDVAVLGMGADGHTASFFPDAENLEELLENSSDDPVLPVRAASAGEPRLTISVQTIAQASHVFLHIEGTEKRRVLENSLALESGGPPIRHVLGSLPRPAEIYWTGEN